jgi:hypothetical protein
MRTPLTFLAAMSFSLGVLAQELPTFEEVDQNSDGRISEMEASTIEGLDFSTTDTNQDGYLSREEYRQAS